MKEKTGKMRNKHFFADQLPQKKKLSGSVRGTRDTESFNACLLLRATTLARTVNATLIHESSHGVEKFPLFNYPDKTLSIAVI